jgi:hypothetical protein
MEKVMDKLTRVLGLCFFLMLSACGSDDNQPFSDNSSLSSSSSSSVSSSSLSGQVSNEKKLEISFSGNGCLESSNADAVTDFDFAGSSRRMLSWTCVYDTGVVGLNLFYRFDPELGCYKKILNDETLKKGALYSKTFFPDCSVPVQTVTQPRYTLEIVDLKIKFVSGLDKFQRGFSFAYELKNNGTLPITQYKTRLTEAKYPSGTSLGSMSSYDSASQLLPGEKELSESSTFYSSEYNLGDLIEFTFVVTDYYGNELASTVKQVSVEQ